MFKRIFIEFVQSLARFWSLIVQIGNNMKKHLHACKWCKLYIYDMWTAWYYHEKESIWVEYVTYAVLRQFWFWHNLRLFPSNHNFTSLIPTLVILWNISYDIVRNWVIKFLSYLKEVQCKVIPPKTTKCCNNM